MVGKQEKIIFPGFSQIRVHVPPGGLHCCSYNCLGFLVKSVKPVGILCKSKRIRKDFKEQKHFVSQ